MSIITRSTRIRAILSRRKWRRQGDAVCDRCHGWCNDGAQCCIAQMLGKPIDWRDLPDAECNPTLITDIKLPGGEA